MSANTNVGIYRCSPRAIRKYIVKCMLANLVPFIQSSPGMGKSAIVGSIAVEYSLKLLDVRLSMADETDLNGLPRFTEDGYAQFVPFKDQFPLEGDELPEGCEGWLLFLDEFNSANKQVQAAAYKLILDRMVGMKKLHPQVRIVCAGNLSSDRAITNILSTAMQSRLVHLEMELSFDDWLEDVALKQSYDKRIIGYLSEYPSKLMDFRPEHQEKTFCCPRTWEFMNRLIKDEVVHDSDTVLYAGTITSGTAADFVQYTKLYDDLIPASEILTDPENCRLPDDNSKRWATVSSMMEVMKPDNFDKMAIYANRFPSTFRILFFRSAMIRMPEVRNQKAFTDAMQSLAKYMRPQP